MKQSRFRWLAAGIFATLALGLFSARTGHRDVRPAAADASATPGGLRPEGRPEGYQPPGPAVARPRVYGIALNGLEAIRRRVQPGQSLSQILQEHGVGYPTILAAAGTAGGVFDVRALQAGQPFCVLRRTGKEPKAEYFIYEKNDIDYLIFDLTDPVSLTCASKPVEIRERTVSGVVEASLWEALRNQRVDPSLAVAMAAIFAWTIDFHHLQPGDRFTALFEEKIVDGEPAGSGGIAGVRFRHRGRDHYAFRFQAGGACGFFDENGASLQKAFLKAPVQYGRISSGYSRRRLHPITGKYRPHPGIDYAAPTGTPVMSVGDGVVVRAAANAANGNCITVRHNDTYTTQYLHLSRFARGMTPGRAVRQGEVIGYVGSTGLATGPHVDFRFRVNGATVNPLTYDMPSATPVQPAFMPPYRDHMAVIKSRLDELYTKLTDPKANET